MVSDYANAPDALHDEKQESLASKYGVVRSTAQKARSVALERLSANRDK
jgi:hypothetical protein